LALPGVLAAAAGRAEGRFLAPRSGDAVSSDSTIHVRWSGACSRDGGSEEGELVLSLDGGLTFPIRLTPEMSACSGSFRWRVPDLATSRARVALRTGSGEESEDEQVTLVSDEFTIVATGPTDADLLIPGSRELWTPQALRGEGTEELPADSLAGSTERLVAPPDSTDASEPPMSGLAPPGFSEASRVEVRSDSSLRHARPPSMRTNAPLPLRL
jgi:hypothetical protein